jgi:hypothetical protein
VLNKDIAFIIKLLEDWGRLWKQIKNRWRRLWIQNYGYPYKFTNPIAGKQEQRKTSLTVGLWEWFQIW